MFLGYSVVAADRVIKPTTASREHIHALVRAPLCVRRSGALSATEDAPNAPVCVPLAEWW
jgi:hypothetical protein